MRSSQPLVRRSIELLLLPVVLALVSACASDLSSPVTTADQALMARVVSTDITVTGTSPDSATQDTTLDVVISGTNFSNDAVATWALAGVADSQHVRTNSTRYVSSRQLVANITISSTATLGKWDVMVMSKGKGGIGTEMFAIKVKSLQGGCGGTTQLLDSRVSMSWATLAEMGSASGVIDDGQGAYVGDVGSVDAKIPYHDATCARSGDIIFDPDRLTGQPTRKLKFVFPAGNGIGLPSTPLSVGPYVDIPAVMELGSDVTWDLAMPAGRDAWIDGKYPSAPRSVEHPSLTADYPGYPSGAAPPLFQAMSVAGCERLTYEVIRRTRVSGVEGFEQLPGQRASDGSPVGKWAPLRNGSWIVESVDTGTPAGHAAQCWTTKKGSLVKNGSPMNMPFRILVSEMQ